MSDREHPLAEPIREGTRRMLNMTRQPATPAAPRTAAEKPAAKARPSPETIIAAAKMARDQSTADDGYTMIAWNLLDQVIGLAEAAAGSGSLDVDELAEVMHDEDWKDDKKGHTWHHCGAANHLDYYPRVAARYVARLRGER